MVCDSNQFVAKRGDYKNEKSIKTQGKLIMIIGRELGFKYIKATLIQNGFSKIESQNLGVKNPLNLKLITAQIEKIGD